jgi:hypothetical protein
VLGALDARVEAVEPGRVRLAIAAREAP